MEARCRSSSERTSLPRRSIQSHHFTRPYEILPYSTEICPIPYIYSEISLNILTNPSFGKAERLVKESADMKLAGIFVSLLVAAVASVTGQTVSTTDGSSTTAVTSGTALSPAQASEAACLQNCASNDATCRTNCVLVGVRVNPIADCQATCVHGNGTDAENLAYDNCMSGCISTAGVQATAITTGSPSTSFATATGTAAGAVNTGGSSGTTTGSSAAATAKTNASDRLHIGLSIGGLLGLFAAMVAL